MLKETQRCFYVKRLKNFFIEHLQWLLLGSGIHYKTTFLETIVVLWGGGDHTWMAGAYLPFKQPLQNIVQNFDDDVIIMKLMSLL